jgi:hypothetical protein
MHDIICGPELAAEYTGVGQCASDQQIVSQIGWLAAFVNEPNARYYSVSIGTAVPLTTIPPVAGISTVSRLGRPIASP